ncbi:hypothetical protein [Pseudonocardia sp. SID8383]|uniref:hypothetical protein n=1 Tax=Pseudonocardia sp. SID8383 TaxID=2690363 RepID=UPI0013707EC3|nr:hypothetical protein [Pseudonocardia sp. SID8383]MYW70813.1 hypothetical protein [Pseudonocardia sp. SID8383]
MEVVVVLFWLVIAFAFFHVLHHVVRRAVRAGIADALGRTDTAPGGGRDDDTG